VEAAVERENMLSALHREVLNQAAAGVDGMTVADLDLDE